MSSSTSSSEYAAGRRVYLRIFATVVVGLGVAMAAVQAFVEANGGRNSTPIGRVYEAMEHMPQITEEDGDLVFVFGSSMVDAGFSPREFDRDIHAAGGNTVSFNFGFGGLNPLFQDHLSRRIAEELTANNRRLKLVVIEFNPFQTTVARRNLQRAVEDSYLALLASDQDMLQFVLDDPEDGIRKALIRYVRDGISAEMITTYLWAEPFMEPRGDLVDIEEEEGVQEQLNEVFEILGTKFDEEYPDFDGSDWYYPWRGGGTIRAERSEETLAAFDDYYRLTQTDYQMTIDRINRVQSADIENLVFDPELVEAFIRVVENFQQVADHVEVVLLPKNDAWIKNPPEALERQAAVVAQIEAATGVPVRDHQNLDEIEISMFSDTTHLNRYYGAVAYTEYLADQYQSLLTN